MAANEKPTAEKAPMRRIAPLKNAAPEPKVKDPNTPEGERIAKVLSRRGVASRREAERLVEAGEVTVNGKTITSPALNVTRRDRITISGHPLPAEEPARLWLYYKPEGLVTSESDEKGRETVFENLPEELPRVMSIGRLDLNSEGLLLLTNDGELKRKLELPSTGWLRKYRVRVKGNPTDVDLEPLRRGITVEGERFQPMIVTLDRHQGANAWVTVGLREGKNREIRRAMTAINMVVNRLIRVSYGPFRLGDLEPGQVEEVRQKVLRDQLGGEMRDEPEEERPRRPAPRKAEDDGPRRPTDGNQRTVKGEPGARPVVKRSTAKPYSAKPFGDGEKAERPAYGAAGQKPASGRSSVGEEARKFKAKNAKGAAAKPASAAARKPIGPRPAAPRKPGGSKPRG
jgi:23S rRNA pseudouridine2605 synthase